MQVAN